MIEVINADKEKLPPLLPETVYLDIDDTVTPEDEEVSLVMSQALRRLQEYTNVVFVTGSEFEDVQARLLNDIVEPTSLHALEVYTSNGNVCHVYNRNTNKWDMRYEVGISDDEKAHIHSVVQKVLSGSDAQSTPSPTPTNPEIIDQRHQVILSILSTSAPDDIKNRWLEDSHRVFLSKLAGQIQQALGKEYAVASTDPMTIAITKNDKSSAVTRDPKRGFMIGNSLREFGNDRPVYTAGVPACIVRGPHDTLRILQKLLSAFEKKE